MERENKERKENIIKKKFYPSHVKTITLGWKKRRKEKIEKVMNCKIQREVKNARVLKKLKKERRSVP